MKLELIHFSLSLFLPLPYKLVLSLEIAFVT
jgi:hypothetical protein